MQGQRRFAILNPDLKPVAESLEVNNQILRKTALLVGAAILGGAVVFAFEFWSTHRATGADASAAAGSEKPTDSGNAKGGEQRWWDPMLGPSSITNHPGKSAMGMDMVPFTPKGASGAGLTVDPAVLQNMGVQTAPVTRGPLHVTVRAVGIFKLPDPGLHDISLKVGGWIDKLYADQEGMHIMKGEPLFALYSPELQVAEQELISAVQSQRSMDRDASPAMRSEGNRCLAGVLISSVDRAGRSAAGYPRNVASTDAA